MNRFIITVILLFSSHLSYSKTIEEQIEAAFKPKVDALAKIIFYKPFESLEFHLSIVVLWLILGAFLFTFYFRFIHIRLFKHAIDITRGLYDKKNEVGEVSHFQALVTALSGTLGLGNISGVAFAISLGGAGATFWMIVAGFLGMTAKFLECTLGVKYRSIDKHGEVSGGPMYYLSRGLAKHNFPILGKILAIIFAVFCVGGAIGGGNMFQANQAYSQISLVYPFLTGNGFVFGVLMAIFVGIVIIGGIQKIANVTDKLVPIMCGIYILVGLVIIFSNIDQAGLAWMRIIDGAFTGNAIFGGTAGALVVGFQRAAFSNEAGIGSAAIAHSAVKTDEPLTEGIVSILEPFLDTIVVCTITALIIIFTGFDTNVSQYSGSQITTMAFSSVFPWFKHILSLSILLFAYATMISWSYYGLKSWTYMFGNTKNSKLTYNLIYLSFMVIGASANMNSVMDFSDMMILGMSFPNILGLYILAPEIKADLKIYIEKLRTTTSN